MMEEDQAMEDELDDIESGREQRNADPAQEGNEDLEAGADEAAVPCRLNIVIEKPNKGALNVEAVAQDGAIVVENLYYYADPKLAHSTDANAVHAAQDTYPGPPFGSLDEDLQILMERYLEERGVTPALALFAPDYMDYKEQKEYMAWLKNVKGFIDA
jgi:complement component 1 Q subcomponent-binding protein